jgi:hypothetical protein
MAFAAQQQRQQPQQQCSLFEPSMLAVRPAAALPQETAAAVSGLVQDEMNGVCNMPMVHFGNKLCCSRS